MYACVCAAYPQALSALVRGGFLVSLLGSFALLMYPLRTCLIELLWGGKQLKGLSGSAKAAAVSKIEQQHFAPITYGILASTVATAVLVPDIWAALSIVGDLASTMQVRAAAANAASLGCTRACAGYVCEGRRAFQLSRPSWHRV